MFRKSFFGLAAIAVVIFANGLTVFSQITVTSGKVELEQADGTRVPVEAAIDIYRTDNKSGFPKGKTDKKGSFSFAGFVPGGIYMFAVSAPGCAPTVFPNVKAGQEKLLITLRPGDGKRFTEAEARAILAGAKTSSDGTSEPGSNDRAALEKEKAKYDAEVAEIEAKNKKNAQNFEKINSLLKEGADAIKVKDYDTAIAKYDEGLVIEPNRVGSSPVLLNNRGTALRQRSVETYNKSVKLTDATAKVSGYNLTKKDILDAIDSHHRAWKMIAEAPATEPKDQAFNESNKINAIREAREAFRISVATEQVDPSVIEAAKILLPEYLAIESDAAKKAEAMLIMADLYRVAGDSENAIAAYKKILETSPENADALAGVGLSMVNEGYVKDDKAMLQEAANYLQKFVSVAPDTHKYKASAAEAITTIKTLSNVAPQKTATPKKKP